MLDIGSYVDGKYKILNKIGQGGMSVVYLAMNERANKQWAIKEVRKDGVSNFEVVKQGLVAEIDLLKKLNHPNLPSIVDVIDSKDSFLIVMDYIEGVSLDKTLENGAASQEDVIEWGKQLCDVLGYLHSRTPPIIYRDMKPANVMLKPDGKVMLIDFGTAREFKSQNIADTVCLGTIGYAAPEQFGGHGQTDARTDIYCLGATLYHLVTGHSPCEPPYEIKPITQWNPMLSTGLENIILKCTQKDPNDRYQSCAELMYALENFESLDRQVIKQRNSRWKTFMSLAAASLIFFTAATGFKVKSVVDEKNNYESYVESVHTYQDFGNLEEAVKIYPNKIDAYVAAIEAVEKSGENGEISSEAFLALSKVCDSKNLKKLKDSNLNQYLYVCYRLGINSMFRSDNKLSACQTYFGYIENAVGDDKSSLPTTKNGSNDYTFTQSDYDNATTLNKLSTALSYKLREQSGANKDSAAKETVIGGEDYYTGDKSDYTYKTYWDNLTAIMNYDFFQNLNARTKLNVYNWIYNALLKDKANLVKDGVTVAEMKSVRDDIVDQLKALKNNDSIGEDSKNEIVDMIESFSEVDASWN